MKTFDNLNHLAAHCLIEQVATPIIRKYGHGGIFEKVLPQAVPMRFPPYKDLIYASIAQSG